MNATVNVFLLLSALGLPLLLAFPALHTRLPRPIHMALLPAATLVFIPVDFAIELPWFWMGAGLGLDALSRWWLAMSVVVWGVGAAFLPTPAKRDDYNQQTSLLLLFLVGQIGAVLATDVIVFFSFTTLMSYACIGLLLAHDDETTRRAGRIYLVLVILADIVLFEAMMTATATTEYLDFATLAKAIALSKSSSFYLSMVIVGIALKVGVWPLHRWLSLSYYSVRPTMALLLWLGPVATGLLCGLRWLPLGELAAPMAGAVLLAIGFATILYAMLSVLWVQWKQRFICVFFIATGSFVIGLGTGLIKPALWNQYEDSAHVFVASLGWGLALMTAGLEWLKNGEETSGSRNENLTKLTAERWFDAFIRWGECMGNDTLPELRDSWFARFKGLWQKRGWQNAFDTGEYFLQRWSIATTLFILLVIVILVLLLLDAM
ncbi:formate hydrogenlyase [Shewanella sp. SG41-4]|uniref:proton-conducting transporter transmembrane domain-containing protein n=1 Tax=Shewanella sp. SG41-4 TaxID=2760976 RepID=UPI001602BB9A|nr:proton-conducting transporter membrane subunit [Shewanella sp. SG41-4]MBB1438273.1 formate hydrogenlyase [Shewanella sp. SG41-4]